MMKLKSLFLCDSANVRDNLLSALAGGLTRMGHENYPNNLEAELAIMFEIVDEPIQGHEVYVECSPMNEPGNIIFRFGGPIMPAQEKAEAVDLLTFPLVLDLSSVGLPAPGLYEVRVELDGQMVGDVHFVAEVVPSMYQSDVAKVNSTHG